jgi:hypothetical protein
VIRATKLLVHSDYFDLTSKCFEPFIQKKKSSEPSQNLCVCDHRLIVLLIQTHVFLHKILLSLSLLEQHLTKIMDRY